MVDRSLLTMDEEETSLPTSGKVDRNALSMEEEKPATPSMFPAGPNTGAGLPSKVYEAPKEAGFLTRTAGSALVGAMNNPITSRVIRSSLGTVPGPLSNLLASDQARRQAFDETVERVAQKIENSTNQDFVRVSELAGEFVPELVMAGGAIGVGKAGAVKGLQKVAPSLAGRGPIGKDMARVAFKSLEDAGEMFPRAMPKIQQATEVLGEAAGLAGFTGVEEYLDSGDIDASVRDAAFTFALMVPAATALRGLGKIPRKGRERNVFDAWKGTSREEFGSTVQAAKDEMAAKSTKTLERIKKVLKVEEHNSVAKTYTEEVAKRGITNPEVIAKYKPRREFTRDQLKTVKKARTELRQQRQALKSFTKLVEHEPLPTNVMGGPRPDPGEVWEGFQKFLVKTWNTPEAFFGRFGKTFQQFGEKVGQAEVFALQGEAASEAIGHKIAEQASLALGMTRLPKNGLFLRPVIEAYEKGKLAGVENYMNATRPQGTQQMLNVFKQVRHSLRDYKDLEVMGAEPWMGDARLAELGLPGGAYWPQQMKRLTDQQLESKLVKSYVKEAAEKGEKITVEQARLRAKEALNSRQSYGLTKSGTIDHNRLFKGSLNDKVSRGMPFEEDPIIGLVTHLSNVSRRTAYGRAFGFNGEIAETVIAAVEAETNAPTAAVARTMVDHFLNRPYADTAMAKIAENLTALQIGLKLPISVIANMSQTSVTAGQAGAENALRGSIRGLNTAIKGAEKDPVLKAVGLSSSMMGVVGDAFMESAIPRGPLGNFARWTLKYTGFDFVERYNRLTAGAATHYDVKDTLVKAWRGRLKGSTLNEARRRMADYGINLGEVIQKARKAGDINKALTPQEWEYAIFKGARATQFIPSQTRKPLGWQNREYGRVLTQFKTFGLNYGRFLKDRILAEAGHGNYKPLITFLGVSQPSGEFVADANSVIRGKTRPDNGIERVLDNQAAVGGLGLLTSAYVSSRWGSLPENLAGPTVGGALSIVQELTAGRPERAMREVTRQPIFTLTKALFFANIITADLIDKYLAADSEGAGVPVEPQSIEELIKPNEGTGN